MAFTPISQDPYFTPSETAAISRSITAVAGDVIYVTIRWRRANAGTPITLGTMSWNGQNLAKYGTTLDDGESRMETHWVQASASATANLTGTLSDSQHYVIETNVDRPPGGTTVSIGGIQEQIYNSGTYADPSLTVASVPAGALSVSSLGYMGWDTAYSPLAGTLSCDSPFTAGDGTTNTNYRGVWALFVARDNASTGSVVAEWTRSDTGEAPQYAHRAFYFTSGVVPAITSITTDDIPGLVVGEPFAITTTNLGTITSITITTDATPAATTSAINLTPGAGEMKYWVGAEFYPFAGTVTVVASDGTLSATTTTTLSIPADQVSVIFNAVETTNNTYIGNKLLAIAHPLANGDIGYYPPADGLTIGTNSHVSSLIGATTFDFEVHKLSGVIERYDVVINDAGEITDVIGITSRGITSRGITSRRITSRGIS